MLTNHKILFSDSRNLSSINNECIDLVVTSPPYPMIQMWDNLFCELNPNIKNELTSFNGSIAFELMHKELDSVWKELARIVKPNGFVCINIGDATRTIGTQFQMYSNHSRITSAFISNGFQSLPIALWKKPTNAPNKFMGSGMLPAGAYVTLEHEYILVFRKGGKRKFNTNDLKKTRNESAIFWEERNIWFSDTWDLKGVRQSIKSSMVRDRNAAFPLELSYRLINMYSVKGDVVLDPFLGTGTTVLSSIASQRNSIGIEYDINLTEIISYGLINIKNDANTLNKKRIENHIKFIEEYQKSKGTLKYGNELYKFPVMTKQETKMQLHFITKTDISDLENIKTEYEPLEFIYKIDKISKLKIPKDTNFEEQLSFFD